MIGCCDVPSTKEYFSLDVCHLPCCCGNESFEFGFLLRVLICLARKEVIDVVLLCSYSEGTTKTAEVVPPRECFRGKVPGLIQSGAFA